MIADFGLNGREDNRQGARKGLGRSQGLTAFRLQRFSFRFEQRPGSAPLLAYSFGSRYRDRTRGAIGERFVPNLKSFAPPVL
jgi:hypothetical protein